MEQSDRAYAMRFVAALATLAGCMSYPADRDYHYRGSQAKLSIENVPVEGFPVALHFIHGSSLPFYELVAVDEQDIWIRPDKAVSKFSLSELRSVTVKVMPAEALKGAGGWAVVGNLMSAGHGAFAWISWPAFTFLVAIPVMVDAGMDNRVTIKPKFFSVLSQWARFPQGLPSGWAKHAKAGVVPHPAPIPARHREDAGLPIL